MNPYQIMEAAIVVGMVAFFAASMTGCIRVVPSTSDASAWSQTWVGQERARADAFYEKYAAWDLSIGCSHLQWQFGETVKDHPDCEELERREYASQKR